MTLDPTNYRTWSDFKDHPIFGASKSSIESWSHDPSRYCELEAYGRFWPELYVHIDPAPPVEEQVQAAKRDIVNLAEACHRIEKAFGDIRYELILLDDFTAYAWISYGQYWLEIYPGLPDGSPILKVFVDGPDIDPIEQDFPSVRMLLKTLSRLLNKESTDQH